MTTEAQTAFLEALALAKRGTACFPCNVDKTPATPGGFKSAVHDVVEVAEIWRLYPGPLVGVPTGEASGFDVLDIDPRHGGDTWLAAEAYRLPITRTHRTRSGGCHVLFRHRAGMRNSAGRIAPGIDIRGTGGYVIWWPVAGLPVENPEAIAEWPEWLLNKLAPQSQARPVAAVPIPGKGYAIAALRRAVDAVAGAVPGTRNETLNREAFALSRFALVNALDPQHIATALATAGLAAGLAEREVRATLASAFRAAGIAL